MSRCLDCELYLARQAEAVKRLDEMIQDYGPPFIRVADPQDLRALRQVLVGQETREPARERWVTHNVTDNDWHPGGGHWHPHRAEKQVSLGKQLVDSPEGRVP